MHLKANCPRNSKMTLKFLIGQVVFKLWIKTVVLMILRYSTKHSNFWLGV